MKKTMIMAVTVLLFIAAPSLWADEIGELKELLNEQSKQLQLLQEKIDKLEAAQKEQEKNVDEKITQAVESKQAAALPDNLKWIENVKISGDLRYRYEMIDEEGVTNGKRNRNRIRARLGIKGKVNDDIDVGMRIATSEDSGDGGDPVSTNQTLDDAFSKKSIWLDLAYFNWHPKDSGWNLIGGKMENPFLCVGDNQLIFDSDLTPEGIALQYTKAISANDELFVNGGGFWVDEVSSSADTSLWGVQSGLKHNFEDSHLIAGASKYCYSNVQGHGALIGSGFQGNTNSASMYSNDYDLAELFGEYGFKYGDKPAALFANYVKNTVASGGDDAGWLIGGKLGKCKAPGSWQVSYDYRELDADAVLGAFNDSDFIGGGTNGEGHRFNFAYQLAKNLQGALTYFLDQKADDDHDYNRLQADVIFKF